MLVDFVAQTGAMCKELPPKDIYFYLPVGPITDESERIENS
jgi:hypothetical protein